MTTKIEQLTDEERALLGGIIDAQAAVIERVRNIQVEHHSRVGDYVSLESVRAALAAAPEHTAPPVEKVLALAEAFADKLAAANARVAELEHLASELEDERERSARHLAEANAANARADAAERLAEERLGIISAQAAQMSANDCDRWLKLHSDWQRAESEAAALRAAILELRAWYVEQVERKNRRADSIWLIARFDEIAARRRGQ